MHRVDTSDNIPALPTSEAAGTAGFFSKGNTGVNDSTVPGQDWFNMIQEELVNVVVQAGITLNVAKNDFTQLYDAIVLLINTNVPSATETVSGKAELATQAETDAGVDDVRIVTPLKMRFGFAISLSVNGYVKLPTWLSGLIIEWGLASNGANTFPLAFTSVYTFVGTAWTTVNGGGASNVINSALSTTSFTVHSNNAHNVRWIAIGK